MWLGTTSRPAGHAERLCRMRDEFPNETLFRNLAHARSLIMAWATDYSAEPPPLGARRRTPAGFTLQLANPIARPG